MRYRVLFFDLDETLVAQEDAFERAYRSTAEWLCREVVEVGRDGGGEPAAVARAIPLAAERALRASRLDPLIRRCGFGGRDLLWGDPGAGVAQATMRHVEAFRVAAWRIVLEDPSVGGPSGNRGLVDARRLAEELGHRFRSAMLSALRTFPDVRPALERLARDYTLAVITNGMGAAQREKLVHLGIDGFFRQVVASLEIGVGKPAGRIFEAAMDALRVMGDEALMVGDSLEGDVEGAEASGIRAVWLDRPGRAFSTTASRKRQGISTLARWSPPDPSTVERLPGRSGAP